MKIAVLGPVCKDYIKIDDDLKVQLGGIPYYVSLALKNLDTEEIVAYATFGKEDKDWILKSFQNINLEPILVEKTLGSHSEYSSANPDVRKNFIQYYPNTIEVNAKLLQDLERFDWIMLSPLFHDNIPFELFSKLRHKNLVHGNFGMFTYSENGKFVKKNPENLIKILPFLQYLFLDKGEAEFVSGKKTIKDSAKFFQEYGLPNAVITDGSKGAHIFIGDKYFKNPAFKPEKLVDPTGAGDTFMAAFIRGTELFNSPQEQGEFAAMVATISLEKRGAFDSNKEEVLKRLANIKK